MTSDSFEWLAGLLEGEGCFSLRHANDPGRRTVPEIRISMTDRDVVERAACLLGGNAVHTLSPTNFSKKPSYVTSVAGSKARLIMTHILPLMGDRRQAKIRELLDF